MTPLEEKLAMVGVDLVSDYLIDLAFRYQSKGIESITPDEILAEAEELKKLRSSEIQKVKDRIKANTDVAEKTE
ncbi:MAG TPA: hypothetical protein VMW06_03305 [Desulfobacterales bacterium]|nr:hypothetical protein [Desulfobacterales bacterium]